MFYFIDFSKMSYYLETIDFSVLNEYDLRGFALSSDWIELLDYNQFLRQNDLL